MQNKPTTSAAASSLEMDAPVDGTTRSGDTFASATAIPAQRQSSAGVARRSAEVAPSSRLAEPPGRTSRLSTWLLLLVCMVAALPAMLIELHEPAAFDPEEAAVLRRSIDTWNYYKNHELIDDSDAQWYWRVTTERLVPYRGAEPQLVDPPGLVWGHEAVFAMGANEAIASPRDTQAAIVKARLVSVLFGVLTVASVFWVGYSLAGARTAAFAALVCAANGVLMYYARLATPSMVYCGFAMLAIAGGMWAMRPLRPYASVVRQVLGWLICGAALGGATLTAGPTAGPAITIPMITIVLLCPHRVTNMLGLVAAHAIAALVLVPWALQAHAHNPDIYTAWLAQLWPVDGSVGGMFDVMGRRAVIALVALLPWTVWLIGALAQPFSASSAGVRQRPFIAFGWFATTALVLLLTPQAGAVSGAEAMGDVRRDLGQILLLIPVASVLIGEMFSHYAELADSGRYPRIWRVLRWPHLVMLLGLSLTAATLFQTQEWLMDRDVLNESLVSDPGLAFWMGLGVVLVAIVAVSVRYALKEYPSRALVCWSLWTLVLGFVLWIPLTRGPMMQRSALPSVVAGPMTQSPSASMTDNTGQQQ